MLWGLITLSIWLYLLTARGGYWRTNTAPLPPPPEQWPDITVIIPARNEEAVIGSTITSLLNQEYAGNVQIILVDDHSSDGTQNIARQAAQHCQQNENLTILGAPPLPHDWSGKVWAMQQGYLHAIEKEHHTPYLFFTDADIDHGPHTLQSLVQRAEGEQLDLVSLMVLLQNKTFSEKSMIPAFVYFFKMLYPFAWINKPGHPLAGAAGGAMLIRNKALQAVNGLQCIQDALIDDCSLGRALKANGKIWLGLTQNSLSTRGYEKMSEIWMMITRSAYTQLNYKPWMLVGSLVGLTFTFLMPVVLSFSSHPITQTLGIASWLCMSASYLPMLRYYRQSILWAPSLPITALIYMGATFDSARRYYAGKGGQWKGRVQAK